jgi:hypothetical protein
MTSCCFFVSLSSLCFATDEDGRAVKNFCNTLFKCINYNLHEEMFCFNVYYIDRCELWGFIREINSDISHVKYQFFLRRNYFYTTISMVVSSLVVLR